MLFCKNPLLKILLLTLSASVFANERTSDNRRYPKPIGALQLGVIVNQADPDSVALGAYYQRVRHIPEGNMLYVRFQPSGDSLSPEIFFELKQQIDAAAAPHIQAFALTWTRPYRVACMSITTAFAAGFDSDFCAKGCNPTRGSPYFGSHSHRPFTDFHWRPTMMIAGKDLDKAKALVDRGKAADGSFRRGTAYLLRTSDSARNVRAVAYPATQRVLNEIMDVRILKQDFIRDRPDVMFYFTGTTQVPHLYSLNFLPGAIADHLTSAGGQLSGSAQMSSLDWLSAGATASYGTVAEPCNFLQKFPLPPVLLQHYLNGEPIIEAYWKSVAWPGQGLFIGEPLARPFALVDTNLATDDRNSTVTLRKRHEQY